MTLETHPLVADTKIKTLEDLSNDFPVVFDTLLFIHRKWLKSNSYTFDLYQVLDNDEVTQESCTILQTFIMWNCETEQDLIDFIKGRPNMIDLENYQTSKDVVDTLFKLQTRWV
jgi:hypothetical protein